MKRIIHLGTFLLIGLFANVAMGQVTYTWGGSIDNDWAKIWNWSKTGIFVHKADFSSGSNIITITEANLSTSSTALAVGHAIVGPGIDASTTVAGFSAIPAVGTTITLSKPTIASGTGATIHTYFRSTTLPGTVPTTDLVVISNGGNPVLTTTPTVNRVTINNAFGAVTGSTLTITGGTLNITSTTVSPLFLNGGNLINNGTLNITSTNVGIHNFLTTAITCGSPAVAPTIDNPTTFSYSGSGALNIDIDAAVYSGSAAVAVTAVNAYTTYKMLFDGATSISLGIALTYIDTNDGNKVKNTAYNAFRTASGANASKLIVGGAGFTIGSVGTGIVNGGLFSLGAQSTTTVNAGTTLTLYSSNSNVTRGISSFSSSTNATSFTNKGTINILGASTQSGLYFSTGTNAGAVPFNITNEGILNVTLSCVGVGNAPLSTGNGGGTGGSGTAMSINNSGTLTLKNTSTATGTGSAIYVSFAGEAPPVNITNDGTINFEGSANNSGTKTTIINNGIINSNNDFISFSSITNSASGTFNFVRTADTGTTKQVTFIVASTALASPSATYTDTPVSANSYVVVNQKFSFALPNPLVANALSSVSVPATGTLTKVSGTGDASIAYSSFSTSLANSAFTSSITNSGTINTDIASNLSVISGVTNASTGVIDPGGASGKGIADFSKAGMPAIASTLRLQVAGNSAAGVDFDQITNSFLDAGFDVTGATLDVTGISGTASPVDIVLVNGIGTITGPFASVIGLTTGWAVDYSTPGKVRLVYTATQPTATIWTGVSNNDFFNEANWKDSVTDAIPAAGSINPGTNINLTLQINTASATITSGAIKFGTGSLAVGSANLSATSLSGGKVTINEGGYLELSSATPFLNDVQINLTSGIGWIRTPNYKTTAVSTNNLAQIQVNGSAAVYQTNLRLDNYYLNGCVIRRNNITATTPLTVYDSVNLSGTSSLITVNTLQSGTAIAGSMNNKIESFILKKGFMATFASEDDGTGKSKNYIASEEDLVINSLPKALQNSISFIRVIPWNWVTKKGRTDTGSDLNTTWRYKWNNTESSNLDWEYVPMAWGGGGANDDADIALYTGKYNSTHVMAFNEADNCNGQSGQFGNPKLCVVDEAVRLYKNLMKTGMRLVSPSCTEGAATGWLKEFRDKATAQDVRIDVIGVHWYDWGGSSNPTTTPNADATQVFNRFKTYLTNVHNLYGLPIWITEFNANPNRTNAVNLEFMQLALPYLETLYYVERYNWYEPNPIAPATVGTADFYEIDGVTLSNVGIAYKNQVSTKAIPEATVNAANSLNLVDYPNVALNKTATASSYYSTYAPSEAVDGNPVDTASAWWVNFGVSGGSNYAPLPAWFEVDLQGSFTIDGIRINEESNALKDFSFQVWNPALNSGAGGWTSVLNITGDLATPLTTYNTFTAVTTTKVRLNITAHNSNDYIKLLELEVYGLPNNPSWTGGTSTNWATATNWSTGIVPNQDSNVTIANGATYQPTISNNATINTLTISSGATLTVTGLNLTVTGAIAISGTMSISNNSNLIQGGTTNSNTGNVIVKRNSNALLRLDYTMWSSPVYSLTQTLAQFSPLTSQSPNRFYTYNPANDSYTNVAPTTPFATGTGYLIRMPNTDPTPNYDTGTATLIYPGVFTGVPNNGTVTLGSLTAGKYYSVGNPYPSTINAALFLSGNSTDGTLYFWRKTNAVANSSGSAYATWTTFGSAASNAAPNNIVPNGTIQVGQGFIVKTLASSMAFTNTMRLDNTSTQFFKTKQLAQKDRVWLNLTNTAGAFSQALVGYMDGATLGVDNGIDGKYINDSAIALSSNINNQEYIIQGRPTFDPSDVVALNFKTDIAGDYTIALDHFDGVFANGQDIYLADSKTGAETDLKAAAYTFTAAAGVDNTRFSLKYQKTLRVDAPSFNENSVRVYKNNGTLYANAGDINISKIKVFDIQGRLIMEQKNLKSTTVMIKNIAATNQVLIIEITSEDNNVVAKKVIN